MPDITGKLLDIGLAPLAALQPIITFTPCNASGDGSSVGDGLLLASRPVSVQTLTNGTFTVKLATTTNLRPDTWYQISISWLEESDGYTNVSYPGFQLRVPDDGGALADLIDAEPTGRMTWIGTSEPPDAVPYLWWSA
jgi:hypothetical protein